MTTFALMAGMMPVAIGVGEGGEFYSPMAVAIIGGTVVSTLLTLLVVPSFYDSIEIARERFAYKLHARAELGNPLVAFLVTLVEALLTLVFFRFFYRVGRWLFDHNTPSEHPVERAARVVGFTVPPGFVARPKKWQRGRRGPGADTGAPMSPGVGNTVPGVSRDHDAPLDPIEAS
jgi:hypothetical protein